MLLDIIVKSKTLRYCKSVNKLTLTNISLSLTGTYTYWVELVLEKTSGIGRVNEYPTMHYLGITRHNRSMVAKNILSEYLWKFQWK